MSAWGHWKESQKQTKNNNHNNNNNNNNHYHKTTTSITATTSPKIFRSNDKLLLVLLQLRPDSELLISTELPNELPVNESN